MLAVAFPAAARAANSPNAASPSADAGDDEAYRKTIKDGVAEYDAHHFEEARSLFRRAHEMNPNARTFRGIGMTSFELRDYVLAVRNLSAALQETRKPLSAGQRKDAQDLLDRSRMFVDVYTLSVSPAEARLLVDARAPDFEPDGTLLLGFGTHTLEARSEGMTTRSLPINVRGGEHKELAVTLEPVPAASALVTGDGTTQIRSGAKSSRASSSNGHAAAWLWAGGGTALLALGAGIYWSVQNSELKSCRNPVAGLRCTDESSISTQWNIGMGTTVGAGAAAVTMALIGILTWDFGKPAAPKHSALDCTIGPFGATCGGAF